MRSEHRDVRLRHPRSGLGGGSLRAIDGREQDPDQHSATAECLEEDGEGLIESQVPFESVVPEVLPTARSRTGRREVLEFVGSSVT